MADINASFTADFSKFKTAVDGAVVQLRTFETNANLVTGALTKTGDSLSGVKIMQQAEIAAEAVKRLGGVSLLTAAELQKVGGIANEAMLKASAMGTTVSGDVNALGTAFRNAQEPAEGLGARITGIVAAGAAAKVAIEGVIAIGREWVTAAGEEENAAVRLNTALRAQGTATPEVVKQYEALAAQFQQTTVFSDDLITEMEAMLVTVGGVLPGQMKLALTATTDLAAGLRIDLPAATLLVSKALEGNLGALKRKGIEIDEMAFKTKGATAVFEAIATEMGGGASDQAATFTGRMEQLGNATNDVEEDLGGVIAKGLKPLIEGFLGLSEPVRNGIITFGFLALAIGSVVAAVAGVGAAIALAAPLLGFTAAGLGTAALGALGAAATASAGFIGALALAIGAVWAAWKIGNIEAVKQSIAEWGLSSDNLTAKLFRAIAGVDQMTPAAARAALAGTAAGEAARKLAEELGKTGPAATDAGLAGATYVEQLKAVVAQVALMTDTQKAEVLAAKALGMSTDDITKKYGLSEYALGLLTKEQTANETAAKKLETAQTNLNGVGISWQATLATINGTVLDAARGYLGAGAAIADVAEKYKLTVAQAKALTEHMADQLAQQKLNDEAILVTTKLWDEYDALRVAHGGTATDAQIADIARWALDLTAKMQKAGNDTVDFYEALAAVSKAKTESVLVDWGAISTHSRKSLQDTADKARATYDYMLEHSDQFTSETIEKFGKIADAAQVAADRWGLAFNDAMDEIAKKASETLPGITQTLNSVFAGISSVAGGRGALVPGRASGGPVSGGSPYWVGERGPELFTPSGNGAITAHGGGGTTVVNVSMTGMLLSNNPSARDDLRRVIDDVVVDSIKRSRKFSY